MADLCWVVSLPWYAAATAFTLGFFYFIAAIPAAAALGLHPLAAAGVAWAGYSAGGAVVLLAGNPARQWLLRRFGINHQPDERKLAWRVWRRFGVPGLGLLAPVTCGPQIGVLIGLVSGEPPRRLLLWISIGVLPWCAAFAILTAAGIQWLGG